MRPSRTDPLHRVEPPEPGSRVQDRLSPARCVRVAGFPNHGQEQSQRCLEGKVQGVPLAAPARVVFRLHERSDIAQILLGKSPAGAEGQ